MWRNGHGVTAEYVPFVYHQDHLCLDAFYVSFGDDGASARDDRNFKTDPR